MNAVVLPTVEQVQKVLETTFYERFKDDHIRDCQVEAVIEAIEIINKQKEQTDDRRG